MTGADVDGGNEDVVATSPDRSGDVECGNRSIGRSVIWRSGRDKFDRRRWGSWWWRDSKVSWE